MVIEWLKFKVDPEVRERFVEQDQAIWTKTLSQQPGFLGKEIWINPTLPNEIVLVIRWQTREQWKAIAPELLAETERKFHQVMGNDTYEMLEAQEHHIRKFLTAATNF
ncbi:MAG: TIGR03792 family protein [Snowella sp.]|nr:TIGR03792 family protein [Snowella sp.]